MEFWLGLLLASALQDGETARILRKYEALRPSDKDLAVYRLNWTHPFDEAVSRGEREGRPIFVMYVTNITAGTNFFTGHC